MTDQQLKEEFQQIEDNFNKAIISNYIEKIKKYISDNWVLIHLPLWAIILLSKLASKGIGVCCSVSQSKAASQS